MTDRAAPNLETFVARNSKSMATVLVPEIRIHLANEPYGIFAEAEAIGAARPYWAFAWPGGQALARMFHDRPDVVAGKRVVDIGAGSGLAAIAALRAGAASADANDTDPLSCAAARLNAKANGVALQISSIDLLDGDLEADLIVIGDLFYEAALAARVRAFVNRAAGRGANVLLGDRATTELAAMSFELEAAYAAPLTPSMETDYAERGCVWRLG